jgi:hypothetical protein
MVNVLVDPTHEVPPFEKVGVTTMLARMGAVVVFVAVNDIELLPLASRPIALLSFVQV